jgi:hypothetical protein
MLNNQSILIISNLILKKKIKDFNHLLMIKHMITKMQMLTDHHLSVLNLYIPSHSMTIKETPNRAVRQHIHISLPISYKNNSNQNNNNNNPNYQPKNPLNKKMISISTKNNRKVADL